MPARVTAVKTERVWGRVPVDRYQKMQELALNEGQSLTQFVGFLLGLGLDQYLRVKEPYSTVPVDVLARVIKHISPDIDKGLAERIAKERR